MKTFKVISIIIGAVILLFSFYWFSYKPRLVRESCARITSQHKTSVFTYSDCMLQNGLKP